MDLQRIMDELLGKTSQGAAPGRTQPEGRPQGQGYGQGQGAGAWGGAGSGQTGGGPTAGGLGGGLSSILAGLGGGAGGGSLGDLLGRVRPPMGNAAGAAAAGGLLGSLLGGKGGGGLLRMGGMAVVGLLAHRAYEQWKAQQGSAAQAPAARDFAQPEAQNAEGRPFGLALIQAMVAAARADGTLDAQERERIFTEAERMQLDPADKAEIFHILETPADPRAIAALATTEAQKAELYTASALIIGEAGAAERAYLDALAGALALPEGLPHTLNAQLREARALAQG